MNILRRGKLMMSDVSIHQPASWIGSDLPNRMTREQFLYLKARMNKLILKNKMDHSLLLEIIDIVNSDSLSFSVLREIIEYLRIQLLSGHKQIVRRTIYLVDALIKNCGPHIYVLVGQKLFMRTLSKVSRFWLLKGSQRSKRLGEFGLDTMQAWGEAFEPRKALYPHIYGAYMHLRSKPYITFPRQQYDPTRVPIFLGPITNRERVLAAEFMKSDQGYDGGVSNEECKHEFAEYDSPAPHDSDHRRNSDLHPAIGSNVDPLSVHYIPPPPPPPPPPRRLQRLSSPIDVSAGDLVEFSSPDEEDDSIENQQIHGPVSAEEPVNVFHSFPSTSGQDLSVFAGSTFDAAFIDEVSSLTDDRISAAFGHMKMPSSTVHSDPFHGMESVGESHQQCTTISDMARVDVGLQCDLASKEDILRMFPPAPLQPSPALQQTAYDPPGPFCPEAAHVSHRHSYPDPPYYERAQQHAMMLHQLETIADRSLPSQPPPPPRPSVVPRCPSPPPPPPSSGPFFSESPAHVHSRRHSEQLQQMRQRRDPTQFIAPSSDPQNRVMYFGNTRHVRRDL